MPAHERTDIPPAPEDEALTLFDHLGSIWIDAEDPINQEEPRDNQTDPAARHGRAAR